MTRPPSTWITAPVMYDALSDSKKAATGATSSTVPKRPSGTIGNTASRFSAGIASVISVSIKPSASALQREASIGKPMMRTHDAKGARRV